MSTTTENTATLSQKIDTLIFDSYTKSVDICLQGRRWFLDVTDENIGSCDEAKYCAEVLSLWRENPTVPLQIDLRLVCPETQQMLLIERWQFVYRRKEDMKDGGRLSAVNRRIVTFLRSLYCFVRLLPGFQLLTLTSSTPMATFRIYNPDNERPPYGDFVCETSFYEFPRIQTFRGTLFVRVRYVGANILQQFLQIPSGLLSGLHDAGHLRQTREGSLHGGRTSIAAAPIPIPGKTSSSTGGGITHTTPRGSFGRYNESSPHMDNRYGVGGGGTYGSRQLDNVAGTPPQHRSIQQQTPPTTPYCGDTNSIHGRNQSIAIPNTTSHAHPYHNQYHQHSTDVPSSSPYSNSPNTHMLLHVGAPRQQSSRSLDSRPVDGGMGLYQAFQRSNEDVYHDKDGIDDTYMQAGNGPYHNQQHPSSQPPQQQQQQQYPSLQQHHDHFHTLQPLIPSHNAPYQSAPTSSSSSPQTTHFHVPPPHHQSNHQSNPDMPYQSNPGPCSYTSGSSPGGECIVLEQLNVSFCCCRLCICV